MKRVALIIPGGIGTGNNNIGVPVLESLVKLLVKDFSITVFSLFKVNESYRPQGFELISIAEKNLVLKSLVLFWYFRKLNRQKRFEVIHGFWAFPCGFLAVIIGKMFRARSIVSVLGGDAVSLPLIQYGQLRRRVSRKLVLWTLHHADGSTALTHYLVDNLKQFGLTRSMVVLPWGVDGIRFSFRQKEVNRPVLFLHVANLNRVKDQATLLKAFKLIAEQIPSELTIIGEGTLKQEIISLAQELGLENQTRFLGLVPYEDIPSFYHRADILLHTSLSEGQSEVVTEAMSCGVLVCGTRVGLMADLPSCCVAVPVGDFQALAKQVISLLGNHQLMNEIRQRGFEWASAHSIHWTVKKTIELYNKVTR